MPAAAEVAGWSGGANFRRLRIAFRRLLLLAPLLLTGCGGLYFHDAGEPPPLRSGQDSALLACREYWTGVVFNGSKIGFSHFRMSDSHDPEGGFEIRSEAVLRFRFLMLDKSVVLKSYDLVGDDLTLVRFSYNYLLDGNRLEVFGRITDEGLETQIVSQNETTRKTLPLDGKLYPASVIGLYPVLHGLEIGGHYSYQVYDGETQSISTVKQETLSYEESELFTGAAFKVRTLFHGQEVTTWMDEKGRPLLEMSLGGVLIAGLEPEDMAREYLAKAAVNKDETLLEYSLVRTNVSIPAPEKVKSLEVAISAPEEALNDAKTDGQECRIADEELICLCTRAEMDADAPERESDDTDGNPYLGSSFAIPTRNAAIYETAAAITLDATTTAGRIRALLDWIRGHIRQKPVDVFTALDVLSRKEAECQGHALLFTAFARALGIPTRVVSGLVYSPDYRGFLYHTWAESQVRGRWIPIDPTFGQMPADATHLKFMEGETLNDLLPMVKLLGKLKIRIIRVETSEETNP